MRVLETNADQRMLPGTFKISRLDGRSFTRLTREVCSLEAPFDERFRKLMVDTALVSAAINELYE